MDDAVAAMREVVKEKKKSREKLDAGEACTVQLGLVHARRREAAPPASAWKRNVEGMYLLAKDDFDTGFYGEDYAWDNDKNKMRRNPPPLLRGGRCMRDTV